MTLLVDTRWKYRGLQVILLENRYLRVTILPELGAKIWQFVYKPSDRNFLWRHPRVEPRRVALGLSYDDNWSGGWDELFPNDEPVTYGDETYPDHGEMWCQPWEWEIHREAGEVRVHLWRDGAVTPVRMEKSITLREGERRLCFYHKVVNPSSFAVDFLWKLHPALDITPGSRIDIPLGKVLIPEGFRNRLGESVTQFQWPFARDQQGRAIDMRRVLPKSARLLELFYGVELEEGWCAMTDADHRIGFGLTFPKEIFSTVWVFASYGGWRDLYTAVLEPCTGYPMRLDEAVREGRYSRLSPGEAMEAEVMAVVYEGASGVEGMTSDGVVIPSAEELK